MSQIDFDERIAIKAAILQVERNRWYVLRTRKPEEPYVFNTKCSENDPFYAFLLPMIGRFLKSIYPNDDREVQNFVLGRLTVTITPQFEHDWFEVRRTANYGGARIARVVGSDPVGGGEPIAGLFCAEKASPFLRPIGDPCVFWIKLEPVVIAPLDTRVELLATEYHITAPEALDRCWPKS